MKGKTSVFAYLAVVAVVAAFALLIFTQQASAGTENSAAMASAANSVLVYSNGMAYVSSIAKGDVATAGRARLKIENFTDNAVLATLRAQDADGEIFWAKNYYEEKTRSEKTERYLTIDELLNQSYGKQVKVSTDDGEVSGKLMWVSGGRVGIESNGRMTVVSDPKRIEADSSQTKKTDEKNTTYFEHGLELYMNAKKSGAHSVLLSYITSGATWKATYNFETAGALKGTGKLTALSEVQNNAGEDWKDTRLRLAVGSPYFIETSGSYYQNYQQYNYQQNYKSAYAPSAAEDMAGGAPSFEGEEIGTQYIYSLSEPVTLLKGEKAVLKLFEAQQDYEKDNVWESSGSVQQAIKVKNSAGKPFAAGVMRVYENGVFMGEGPIAYTGDGRKAEAKYAVNNELKVKKESNQSSLPGYSSYRETIYSVTMKITSSGSESYPLTLRDYMGYADRAEVLSSSHPVSRLSDNKLEWKLDVPAGANVTVKYAYKLIWY